VGVSTGSGCIVVFSGSAHAGLAQLICNELGVPLSPAPVKRFSNDCLQVQLQANCRNRDVYVVQPLVPPTQEHLMELLLMLDAARGASSERVTAVIPHFAYARSDKKDASRIAIGGRLVADMLATAGADRVITMALHAPQVHGFFSVPVDHLTAIGELAQHYRGRDLSNTVVVSPDLGNAKTATQFARLLGLPVAAGSKQRLADDRVVIDAIVGDVSGKDVLVLDDEIATGASIVQLLDRLAEEGCGSASVACTHGLFTGKAVDRLRSHPTVTEVVTTDTVPPPDQDWPELAVRCSPRPSLESTPVSRSAVSSTASTRRTHRRRRSCRSEALTSRHVHQITCDLRRRIGSAGNQAPTIRQWLTHPSGSSTPASVASPSPARCSTSCRTSRCCTSATPPASRTAPSRSLWSASTRWSAWTALSTLE
jgi:ribose-phosphate pyrophosphokinase